MDIKSVLGSKIDAAFTQLGLQGQAAVQASARAEFGDYQANGVMAAAKRAKKNPREVASQVVDILDLAGIASKVEVAGPGFLNITLEAKFLAQNMPGRVDAVDEVATIVVDYSAPNLAKEMHVGHLRSSIIGDCLVRVLEARGHHVIRQNHVGDWGTQFGMLLTFMQDNNADGRTDALADLESFYRAAKVRFDADDNFRSRARLAVVGLQSGDADSLSAWQHFIDISMTHCDDIYQRLGVTLTRKDIAGESSYNDDLAQVVEDLDAQSLLQESDGAQCVFLDQFKNKKGDILPVIVRKSDGGYLYATTDLAAVRHRTGTLKADRVLYFTDARQSLHFKQIFAVASAAGFNMNNASLEHMPFGSMLDAKGKPFKSREGGVIKLSDLLDEAERRATVLVRQKNPGMSQDEAESLGRVIGIGAIKYADLSKNRTSDYVFDWNQMISFEGNTAPYLQYAYTRIQSLFSKGDVKVEDLPSQVIAVDEYERRLAVTLAGFNDMLDQVAEEGSPHLLCGYLYELATRFTQFYEACPILKSDGQDRSRRLALANDTAMTLRQGLDLLGIGVVSHM